MSKTHVWRLTSIVALTAVMILLTDTWAAKQADAYRQLDLLVEVRHELVDSYVEEPDQLELIEAAVDGMVESLDDPYTVFVPAQDVSQLEERLTGSFSGIGAEIDMYDGRPRIVTPLEDSPAWKAGILAGDIILEVDGETTQDKDQMEVIQRIKGEPGTDVVLKVRRETGEELQITVTRAHIDVQTVRGARRKADQSYDYMLDPVNKIGYVRITQFTRSTAGELRQALEQLLEQDVKGLIIDVRFDPGGLLESAVEVCDLFLTEGKRIVSTKGRKWPEEVHDATADTVMPDTPLVILANENSASASEVVTGALSDNNRALFVGTRTFGKGSVQQVREMDSGLGALKITGAYYYLPSGRNIHRKPDAEVWGVDPSEGAYVPMSFEQYEKMIQARRDADVLRPENGHEDSAAVTPEWIENQMFDPQLAAALRAALGMIETGDWPTVGESNAEELVRLHERELLERRRDILLKELARVEKELADGDADAAEESAEAETTKPDERAETPQPEPNSEAEAKEESAPKPSAEVKEEAAPKPEPKAEPKAEPAPEPQAKQDPKPEQEPAPAEPAPAETPQPEPAQP